MFVAQGLGHPDERLIWLLAIPSYAGGLVCLYIVARIVEEEIWYRRLMRKGRRLAISI